MQIRQFQIPGLGHLSALVSDDGRRVAAVVDPRRDVDVYLEAARAAGVRITQVVETHLHNDYVSGARDLAALTGATHLIGRGAELRYEHRGLADGESVDVGSLRFTALDTPGHTPEHVIYALADRSRADEPVHLFTGGSLLVGSVGRTDLLGAENAVPFARQMFHSLHDVVLRHEDFVGVYPTHGAGSLCSTGIADTPASTVGFERRYNPLLRHEDAEDFARALLADQPAFPRYFAGMRPTNQSGPTLLGGTLPERRPMAAAAVTAALDGGALVVDLRRTRDYAAGHIPGSVSIPLEDSFGTWLGWVVDPDRPIVLLLADPADWDVVIRQIVRIGYEPSVLGDLDDGWDAWMRSGGRVAMHERVRVADLAERVAAGGPDAPVVIDVRQASEFAGAHIPGSLHILAADLPARLAELPRDRPIATVCASGFRSSIAASLLDQAGFERVAVVEPGVPAWEAAGLPVERS